MAKKDKTEETPAEETTVVKDRKYLKTKVNAVHEGHAAYIKEQFGVDVPPEFIFAVYSTRVAYRKTSDQYQSAKSARQEAREQAEKEKAETKEQAKKEREAKKAEKEKAKAEKAAAAKAAEEKEEKATKAAASKSKSTKASGSTGKGGKKKPF